MVLIIKRLLSILSLKKIRIAHRFINERQKQKKRRRQLIESSSPKISSSGDLNEKSLLFNSS